jgi:hypothetical protein
MWPHDGEEGSGGRAAVERGKVSVPITGMEIASKEDTGREGYKNICGEKTGEYKI